MAANQKLYLHEIIHIVGTGSEPYKRHTGYLGLGRTDGGSPLVGTFQQCGSTGDWPKVINLWEMSGWDHWAEILEKQYTRASAQDPELKKWWDEALRHRSGGFDRILEPAPYCPTRDQVISQKIKGMACLQEIATVLPGKADDYLQAVKSDWLPIAEQRGMRLIGAYRTAMRDTEAVLLWSFPTFAAYTRHLSDYGFARETQSWAEWARKWRTDYRETLLVPSPWCIVHPDFRDEKPVLESVPAKPPTAPRAAARKAASKAQKRKPKARPRARR
jgi:hypothetical protein